MTKRIDKEEILMDVVKSITCDCCSREVDVIDGIFEAQEMLAFGTTGGFGSKIGDGVKWSIDLCQVCTWSLLGKYIQIDDVDYED